MTNVPKSTKRAVEHLSPIVEARRNQLEEYGTSWDDKPVGCLVVVEKTTHPHFGRTIFCLG